MCVRYTHMQYICVHIISKPLLYVASQSSYGGHYSLLAVSCVFVFYSPRPTPEKRCDALAQAMAEILWRAGNYSMVTVAT